MRKNSNTICRMLCALLLAVFMVTTAAPALAVTSGDILTVKQDYTRLRAKPGKGSAVVTKLRKGTKVVFLKEVNGYYKLELSNGKTGYMYKSLVKRYLSAKVGEIYRPRVSKLSVRTKPNSKSKARFKVSGKTNMVLLERKGSWGLVRVISSGKVGYVNLKYLKKAKK